jgi:hypothetical protein
MPDDVVEGVESFLDGEGEGVAAASVSDGFCQRKVEKNLLFRPEIASSLERGR